MKIKNTRELVLRARGHARADHIQQGTYGDAEANGHVEFKGCAIGCLATPHRKSQLRSFIHSLGFQPADDGRWVLTEGGHEQVQRLRAEFGISPALARCAEALFEALPTNGAAINFIPRFAAALNEGAQITPAKLRRAWPQIIDDSGYIDRRHGLRAHGRQDYYVDAPDNTKAKAAADRFIAWLEEQH